MSNQNWLQRFFGKKPGQQKAPQSVTFSEAEMQHMAAEIWHIMQQTIDQENSSDDPLQTVVATPPGEEALAAVPAAWQIGDVILDQYEVTDKLGEGGMGTVYKARHHGWNIDLAVKCPRPQTFATEHGKASFTREAETWVNLQLHPHIVACYYVRVLGGIPRVFAEYVAGGSLADWIRRRRVYQDGHEQALERMLDIAIQFAWGLHAAHEQGLVHQDIKPANVMLTPEGIVKVTDFGLARARTLAGEPVSENESGPQSILVSSRGMTPAYCSPEQAKGEALSRKTDIWSWGVSVLEMFVGEVTWRSGALARDALASYDTPDDTTIPPMPKAVMLLLARCFESAPENRPASMLEVATELQAIYAHEVGQAYPRKMPQTAEMLADSLNNRGLSLASLGKLNEAQQLWEQALQADPRHLGTTYNQGVLRWRRGEITDDALVRQLEIVRNVHNPQWQASYLLAQVHLERGDREAALPLLEEAAKQAPAAQEVQRLYNRVRAEKIPGKPTMFTLEGHRSDIYAVDITADGRIAISAEGNSVRIWDVDTGRCLHVLQEKEIWPAIKVVGLSADARVAIFAKSKKISLWDVKTGRCLRTLQQKSEVMNARLSADGNLVISGDGNAAHIWNARSGRKVRTLQHPHEVEAVELSVDGQLAVTSSGFLPPGGVRGKENTLQLWDVNAGRCLLTLEQAGGGVDAVSLSADNRLLAANISDNVHVWETSSGRSLKVLSAHSHTAHALRLSANGRWLVSGSPDRTVRLWDVNAGRCLRTLQHSEWVWGASISADGKRIISGGTDDIVRVWELDQHRILCSLHPSQAFSHTEVTQTKGHAENLLEQFEQAYAEKRYGEALTLLREVRALPGWERRPECLDAWARLTPHCVRTGFRAAWQAQTFQVGARAVNLSADGRLAAFANGASVGASVQVWETSEGRCLHNLQGHTGEINAVSLSEDTRWVVSGSSDKTVRLWDRSNGRCLQVLQGHTDSVMTVDMSADGKLIVSSGHDGYIRIWEATTGRCLRVLDAAPGERGVRRWVYRVSISADGRLLLSGGQDGSMRVWEVSTGRCLHVIKEHLGPVSSVNITEDGQFAISGGPETAFSGSGDRAICIWEISTGRCLRMIKASFGMQHDVNISPDGRWIVSGGANQLVQLWEASSGRCLCTLQGHNNWVHSVCLSADGRWLLSAARGGTMCLWELDWELDALPMKNDASERQYHQALQYREKAASFYAQGDYQQALKDADAALQLHPDFPEALHTKGSALHGLGEYTQAIQCFEKAISLKSDYAMAHIGKAFALSEMRDYEPALQAFDAGLALYPHIPSAHFNRGIVLAELGRYQEAVTAYDQACRLGLEPSMMETYYVKKGMALAEARDVVEALKVVAEGIRSFPRAYDLFMLKGILLSNLGQMQLAVAALDQAIQLNHREAEGSYIKGEILLNTGQLEPALAAFEQAIKRQPNYPNALVGKGMVLGTLGRHKEAVPAFTEALRLDPKNVDAYNNLSNALMLLGQPLRALDVAEDGIRLSPHDAELYRKKGLALEHLERHSEALAAYDRALFYEPTKADAYHDKGVLLDKMGKPKEALEELNKALSLNPQAAISYHSKAIVLHKLLRYQDAIEACDAAIKIEPQFLAAHAKKARIIKDMASQTR